ncbi:hypothetical protein FHR34_006671 [Kitasatospora kifunensis]|uniref:eCIS core domain-containing protein n=2 Tax=Kitasatospora kifunensis TaxID=58351 RepID=A0A7W7R8Z3_KITKI|nr:hypothetical protein [Kitasatospora kifunensis]
MARMIEEERRRLGGDTDPVRPPAQPVQRSLVHQVLRTAGRPLDGATRHEMESRLGADFSDVRLHTGSTARASAAEVGARAYTSGNHVVLGDGGGDRHTLAHELTHVIQQRHGPVAGTDNGDGLKVSDPSDRHEREAEANATRALSAPLAPDHAWIPDDGGEPVVSGVAVQRMPKRNKDTAELKGNSPPPQRRNTRGSARAEGLDLNKPTLEFESSYEGPRTQQLHAAQNIGFDQVAKLKNPPGAPQKVATNYHFWQEVTDSNVQLVEADGLDDQTSTRGWVQDSFYRPPYNTSVISNGQDSLEFQDNPGFSTSAKMTSGYWLKSYTVSFRWKVARNTGTWNRNLPCWTSPVVTHTLTSAFDPENPEASAAITARAAGNHTWQVDLSTVGEAEGS